MRMCKANRQDKVNDVMPRSETSKTTAIAITRDRKIGHVFAVSTVRKSATVGLQGIGYE